MSNAYDDISELQVIQCFSSFTLSGFSKEVGIYLPPSLVSVTECLAGTIRSCLLLLNGGITLNFLTTLTIYSPGISSCDFLCVSLLQAGV